MIAAMAAAHATGEYSYQQIAEACWALHDGLTRGTGCESGES